MGAEQQRQRQCEREQCIAPQGRRSIGWGGDGFCLNRCGITGSADCGEQVVRRRCASHCLDPRRFGREIDAGLHDAGHRAQRRFEPRNAARAGHALDRQANRLRRDRVAGVVDGAGERLRVERRALDGRRLGGQVHGDAGYAGDLMQRLFDMRDAAGTSHPLHRQHDP